MTRSAALVTVPWDSECADIPRAPAALLRELGVVMTPFSMSSLASASAWRGLIPRVLRAIRVCLCRVLPLRLRRLTVRLVLNSYPVREILPVRPKRGTALQHWHPEPLSVRRSRRRTQNLQLGKSHARLRTALSTNTMLPEHPGMGALLEAEEL